MNFPPYPHQVFATGGSGLLAPSGFFGRRRWLLPIICSFAPGYWFGASSYAESPVATVIDALNEAKTRGELFRMQSEKTALFFTHRFRFCAYRNSGVDSRGLYR